MFIAGSTYFLRSVCSCWFSRNEWAVRVGAHSGSATAVSKVKHWLERTARQAESSFKSLCYSLAPLPPAPTVIKSAVH